MHARNGLTVLELIVGLMLIGVILTLGAPALQQIILNARMTAQVNRFVRGIHLAKQAALTNTTEVVICKSHTGTHCEHDREWGTGWLIFANRDRDYPPQIDADEQRLLASPAFQNGTIVSNRRQFIFRPFQSRSTNGTVHFCDQRGYRYSRRIIISYTGRPRVAAPDGEQLDSNVCSD